MAGSHLPGDPYYSNQDSGEGIESDLEEEFQEEKHEDSDADSEDNNLPLVAPIQNPIPQKGFQGLTPLWATNLNRWSQEQDQPLPYNGDRSFTI